MRTPAAVTASRSMAEAEVRDVGVEEVVTLGGAGRPRLADRGPADLAQPRGEQRIGAVLDHRRDIGRRRAAFRGVVLEAAVCWRVVGRRDDDAVGPAPLGRSGCGPARRGKAPASACTRPWASTSTVAPLAASTSSAVTQAGSDRAWVSRARNRGPSMPAPGPVVADRLRYDGNMVVVEADPEARTPVAGRPERDPLVGVGRVRVLAVVGGNQLGDVDEVGGSGRLSGAGVVRHGALSWFVWPWSIWAVMAYMGRVRAVREPSRVFPRTQVQATSMTTFRRPAWGRAYRE